jgi:transposase
MKLMVAYASGKYTKAELAAAFGVSRKTVYKWLGRVGSEAGLADRFQSPA